MSQTLPTMPVPQPTAVPPSEGGAPPSLAPAPKVPFLRSPVVQSVLPLATSLVLHLAIIVIGFATFKVGQVVVRAVKEQIIVPDAAIVEGQPVGGIVNPGLGSDPNRTSSQDQVQAAESSGWGEKKSESLTQSLMSGGANDGTESTIGVGAAAAKGTGGGSAGSQDEGGDGESGGAIAPFGVPGGGGGAGPKANFLGISGNARKVVYLCDASGSMMTVFPHVKAELHNSLDKLRPTQSFGVIFFNEKSTAFNGGGSLYMATPANKLAAFKFADAQYAAGGTDPTGAIKMAFALQPDLIYCLTDGFDNVESFDAVIKEFKTLNVGGHTKVNTILLKSSSDPQLEQTLQTIAHDNGGQFKAIDESDF